MQQITIRGLDPAVEKKIRSIARHQNKSINQVIKEIVHKEFRREHAPASSLAALAGGWTREEADAFEQAIATCEQVDEEMWK